MIANSTIPHKQDVFGASVSDFDPWADDDCGGPVVEGFGDFASDESRSGFFKDDFTASTVSLAQSESPDLSHSPLDESGSLEKDNSSSNHNSVSPDLTSPSRSGRSERSKLSTNRRKVSSRSRCSADHVQSSADADDASEEVEALERRAPERKHSSSSHSLLRLPRDDSGAGDEIAPTRNKPPPMRRRSNSRRAMLDSIAALPKRAARSERDPSLEEEQGDDPADDIETDKDIDIPGRGHRRGMPVSQRNSFRVSRRGNAENGTDNTTGVSPAEKETLGNVSAPPSAPSNRRASMTNAGHRQLSSRRLSGVADGKSIVKQNSLRHLFREEDAKDTDTDASTVNDDGSATIISRSVLQRSSSRRGNLTKTASGTHGRPPNGDAAHRTISRTPSLNRKVDGGEQTAPMDRPTSDKRASLQRSNSARMRRPSSVRGNLTGQDESPEGGDSSAVPGPSNDLSPRVPRHLPPPRASSMSGTLSHRRLQGRASKDLSIQRKDMQQQ
jgi:hypothetical protein